MNSTSFLVGGTMYANGMIGSNVSLINGSFTNLKVDNTLWTLGASIVNLAYVSGSATGVCYADNASSAGVYFLDELLQISK